MDAVVKSFPRVDQKPETKIEPVERPTREAGLQAEGQGLRGMRERVEASGGTMMQRRDRGTRLVIRLPLITDAKATA